MVWPGLAGLGKFGTVWIFDETLQSAEQLSTVHVEQLYFQAGELLTPAPSWPPHQLSPSLSRSESLFAFWVNQVCVRHGQQILVKGITVYWCSRCFLELPFILSLSTENMCFQGSLGWKIRAKKVDWKKDKMLHVLVYAQLFSVYTTVKPPRQLIHQSAQRGWVGKGRPAFRPQSLIPKTRMTVDGPKLLTTFLSMLWLGNHYTCNDVWNRNDRILIEDRE